MQTKGSTIPATCIRSPAFLLDFLCISQNKIPLHKDGSLPTGLPCLAKIGKFIITIINY